MKTLRIATRGSALALAQARTVAALCRELFPELKSALRVFKTTGDKLQTADPTQAGGTLPKGLFTKELEVALLSGDADIAVHSLKDLPTDLPDRLILGAVLKRADARDVLVMREESIQGNPAVRPACVADRLRQGATVATSSPRRQAQMLSRRADLKLVEIRGNVGTRLRKLADLTHLDGTLLAAAGLQRLGFVIGSDARLSGEDVPGGLKAFELEFEEMLPCVGQAAIGIEIRAGDAFASEICARLDDSDTHQCVAAERAFLKGMGGGCQSPVAAIGTFQCGHLELRGVSYHGGSFRQGLVRVGTNGAAEAGTLLARELSSGFGG